MLSGIREAMPCECIDNAIRVFRDSDASSPRWPNRATSS